MQDATRRNDNWLAGVDGCRAGWLVVLIRPTAMEAHVEMVADFSGVAAM